MSHHRIYLTGRRYTYSFAPGSRADALKAVGALTSSYLGLNETLRTPVVVKRLNPSLTQRREALTRLVMEAEVANALDDPELATEVLAEGAQLFAVRPYIEGKSLKELLRGWPRPRGWDRFVVRCLIAAAEPIGRLHRQGLVHCDLKPENLLVCRDPPGKGVNELSPRVKLIDFGLAQVAGGPPPQGAGKLPFPLIFGAPEQVLDLKELVNPTTDVFGLCVTLYALIKGTPPYPETNPLKLMQLQIAHPLPPSPRLPEALMRIVRQGTAKPKLTRPPRGYTPDELARLAREAQQSRHRSMEELRGELESALAQMPARRGWW